MDPAEENRRLRAALAEREATIAEREATIAELGATVADLGATVADLEIRLAAAEEAAQRLQRDVEKLKRQLVGPRSERVVDPDAAVLPMPPASTALPELPTDAATTNTEEKTKKKRKPPKVKPHGRRDLSEENGIPAVLVEGKVGACGCLRCGRPMRSIGPHVSWRLEWVPGHFVRHKIVLDQCACPEHPQAGVVTAPCPISYALPKALCGNVLLANIAIDKYADHLPLHRQSGRFEREGVRLPVPTLCDWLMQFADVARPIHQQIRLQVRSEPWLRSDATGLPVRDDKLNGRTHHGHLWCYGNYDQVVFDYTPDKSAPTVAAMFAGFQGTVVIDGATDFNLLEKIDGVERAGCWAHARRYFYEALSADAKRATAALAMIRKLFLAERIVMAAGEADRLALRDELCRPIVEGFRIWLDELWPALEPKNPLHAAVQYARNQWDRLAVFLRNPAIPAHNNDSERDLRKAVTGRRNWLVAGSARGARAMATYYTLVGSCLLQGIDPRAYLVEIMGRLDEPAARLTPAAIREQWEDAASLALPPIEGG